MLLASATQGQGSRPGLASLGETDSEQIHLYCKLEETIFFILLPSRTMSFPGVPFQTAWAAGDLALKYTALVWGCSTDETSPLFSVDPLVPRP